MGRLYLNLTLIFSKPTHVRTGKEIASLLSQMLPNTQGKWLASQLLKWGKDFELKWGNNVGMIAHNYSV